MNRSPRSRSGTGTDGVDPAVAFAVQKVTNELEMMKVERDNLQKANERLQEKMKVSDKNSKQIKQVGATVAKFQEEIDQAK